VISTLRTFVEAIVYIDVINYASIFTICYLIDLFSTNENENFYIEEYFFIVPFSCLVIIFY